MSLRIPANMALRQPALPSGPPCAAVATASSAPSEPNYQALFDANTRVPDLRRFMEQRLQPVATAAAAPLAFGVSTSPVAAKLDEIERQYAGPYRVEGRTQPIPARAMFHSANGQNAQLRSNRQLLAEANRACTTKALSDALTACRDARPTPAQLVMVTQALLDHGALKGVSPIGSQDIRAMQQRFCIGIDCIGYVRTCQLAMHGAGFDRATKHQTFVDMLKTNRFYAERPGGLSGVAQARPGDVLHLGPASTTEGREHNVIVRQRESLSTSDPRWASLANGGADLMKGGGPVHLLDVVQSGGGLDDVRGVRHQTWLYDQSSGAWGVVEPATKQVRVYERGPQEHPNGFVFTPRKPVR